ncbi:MAG: hypothetical protein ACYS9X_08000 [Planctomycetota bacterium]|jgi:hypothetical protein
MIDAILGSAHIEQLKWARPVSTVSVVAAVIAVTAFTGYLYRRSQGLPRWVHVSLAAARLAVLCIVVVALFEPAAVVSKTRDLKRRLNVLIDVSESMSVKDQRKRPEDIVEASVALGILPASATEDASRAAVELDAEQRREIAGASRLDLATRILSRSARDVFESIGDDLDVSYYAFGEKLYALSDEGSDLDGLEATKPGTSMAESLGRTEGVVHDLGMRGIPVFPVPIGTADPDDVSIRNTIIQEVAFSGDKVPVRVQIQSRGYEKRIADLIVGLNGRSVARRSITLEGGMQFEDIFFNVDVYQKGVATVAVSIEPFSDEATPDNNLVQRSVRIVNERINVLCVEGSPRWEYRYLLAMLKRDPRINATFIVTVAKEEVARNSSEYLARFPEDREEAFEYDLVILGDVDADFFSAEAFQRLEELVRDRGGSLVMLSGARFAPSSYAGTPLERMLPVEFESDAPWEDVDDTVYPVLTPEGRSSLVMTLEPDQEENDRVWSRVAPLDWVPPLVGARPGATVLAELSDAGSRTGRYPLVTWQRYGTGKCMFIGTDRLWLLRFKLGDKYHWRVWSQFIQFMTLSRLMGEHKRIRLETDRATYSFGEQTQLYAHVLDSGYEPVIQAGFSVKVSSLDAAGTASERIVLRPDASNPGLYEGYYSPPRPGRYRLEANAEDGELSNTTEFQVSDVKPEMARIDMQIGRLRRIADLSGGKCVSISELQDLPSLLNLQPHTISVRAERPLWDSWLVVLLLAGLGGLEWIVRRRYDLP